VQVDPIIAAIDAKKQSYMAGGKVVDQSAIDALENAKQTVVQYAPEVSFGTLNKARQILDQKIAGARGTRGFITPVEPGSSVDALMDTSGAMREALANTNGAEAVRDAKAEYSFQRALDTVVGATKTRTQAQRPPLVTSTATAVGGGVGMAMGGPAGAAKGAILFRALAKLADSTAWNTISGAAKATLADLLAKNDLDGAQKYVALLEAPKTPYGVSGVTVPDIDIRPRGQQWQAPQLEAPRTPYGVSGVTVPDVAGVPPMPYNAGLLPAPTEETPNAPFVMPQARGVLPVDINRMGYGPAGEPMPYSPTQLGHTEQVPIPPQIDWRKAGPGYGAAPALPGQGGLDLVPPQPGAPKASESAILPPEAQANAGQPAEAETGGGQPAGQSPTLLAARPPSSPVGYGAGTSVATTDSPVALPARYAVRELSDIQASHNAGNFQRNQNYQFVNDRDYTKPEAANRVISNSGSGFNPNYLITDNPDATNGPPVIDPNGNVLGGNSRAMILGRVYAGNPRGAAAYRDLLTQKAAQFGLDPAQISQMKQPVLVREATHVLPTEEAQRLIGSYNQPPTAALSPAERALSDSRRLSPETLDYLAGKVEDQGPDGTLAQALEGKNGPAIVNRLVQDGVITAQERPQYIDERGVLTAPGKQRIAHLLTGRLFDDPAQLESTPPSVRNKLERLVPTLARLESRPEWDLTPQVKEAVSALEESRAHDITDMSDLVRQQGMFAGGPQYSPEALHIAQLIRDTPGRKLSQAFSQYAQDEAMSRHGQEMMFGQPPTRPEAFERAFGQPSQFAKGGVVAPKHDFSHAGVDIPDPMATAMAGHAAAIPYDSLAKDGRESVPHITLMFGFNSPDPTPVANLLAGEPPIVAKMGKTSLFKNDDADVLKMDVDSPDLHRLNQKVSQLPNGNTHPSYVPHATIAYLHPGEGDKYAGRSIPGVTGNNVVFHSVTFSSPDGTKTQIPLTVPDTKELPGTTAGEMKEQGLEQMAKGGVINANALPDVKAKATGVPPGQQAAHPAVSGTELVRGSLDVPLSPGGVTDATDLAKKYAAKGGISRIISGNLTRTRQTAQILRNYSPNAAIGLTPNLQAWHLGSLEGKPKAGVIRQIENYIRYKQGIAPPGMAQGSTAPGESYRHFGMRLVPEFKNAMAEYLRHPNSIDVMVVHRSVISWLYGWLKAGMPPDGMADPNEVLRDKPDADAYRLAPARKGAWQLQPVDMSSPGRNKPGIYISPHGATAMNETEEKSKPLEKFSKGGEVTQAA
jgi:broad specificity phosphatase PhoE/2'-5' RNA ligase